jgi:hypothetical protein
MSAIIYDLSQHRQFRDRIPRQHRPAIAPPPHHQRGNRVTAPIGDDAA